MSNQKYYDIEFYMPPPVDKWTRLPSFACMRKSFAEGAWAMLRATYNHDREHRLVCNGQVVQTLGKQRVGVSTTGVNNE
jgi:hypothetical protein